MRTHLYFNDFCVYLFRCFHFYFNQIANELHPQMFVTTIEKFFGLKHFILGKHTVSFEVNKEKSTILMLMRYLCKAS